MFMYKIIDFIDWNWLKFLENRLFNCLSIIPQHRNLFNSPVTIVLFQDIFPFGLKWKPFLRRHVVISVRTFPHEIKIISSSIFENKSYFNNFYHLGEVNESKSEVWKGKNLCHWGVKLKIPYYDMKRIFELFIPEHFIEMPYFSFYRILTLNAIS